MSSGGGQEGTDVDARTGAVMFRDRLLRRLYLPAYGVGEAAQLAGIHRTTVSRWFYAGSSRPGRRCGRVLADKDQGCPLSYLQLVEVAFVATLRNMGVQLSRIRVARDYLRKIFDVEYPFAMRRLKTDGARILIDLRAEEGQWINRLLVEASAHGQIIWAEPILDRIEEFDWDDVRQLAMRWFPRGRNARLVVDPQIQFGAPILRDSAVPTLVVKGRFEAGESMKEIEEDFGIDEAAIREALVFEGIQPLVAVA